MALLQIVQTEHGVPSTYWKISSVIFNLDNSCTIKLDGYYDESARKLNYEPMKQFSYTVNSTDMGNVFPSGFNLVDAYEFVKSQTQFATGSMSVI
jgi:hypothetical protein